MINRHPSEMNSTKNSDLFWVRHHIEMVKDSALRCLNIVNHFDTIVEPDQESNGAIYLGAQPVNWGGYNVKEIITNIGFLHNGSNHKTTFFSILEDEELHHGPYIDKDDLSFTQYQKIDVQSDHSPDEDSDDITTPGLSDQAINGHQRYQLELKDYQAFTVNDHENILETIKKIHEARQNGSVYIHCKSGMGRSMSILLCYLTLHVFEGDIERAYDHIKEKRWIISAKDSDHYKAAEIFCRKHAKQKKETTGLLIETETNETDYHTIREIKLAAIIKLAEHHHIPIQYTHGNARLDHKKSKERYEKLINRVKKVKAQINDQVTDRILKPRQSFCPTFFNSHSQKHNNKINFFKGLTELFPKLYDETSDQVKVNAANLVNERSNPDLLIASLEKYIAQLKKEIKAQKGSIVSFISIKENKKIAAQKMLNTLTKLDGKRQRKDLVFTREDIRCLNNGRLGEIINFHHQSLPIEYVYSKNHYTSSDIAMNLLMR